MYNYGTSNSYGNSYLDSTGWDSIFDIGLDVIYIDDSWSDSGELRFRNKDDVKKWLDNNYSKLLDDVDVIIGGFFANFMMTKGSGDATYFGRTIYLNSKYDIQPGDALPNSYQMFGAVTHESLHICR